MGLAVRVDVPRWSLYVQFIAVIMMQSVADMGISRRLPKNVALGLSNSLGANSPVRVLAKSAIYVTVNGACV